MPYKILDVVATKMDKLLGFLNLHHSYFVTIQPPPNQLANIDFDVIGTSDY